MSYETPSIYRTAGFASMPSVEAAGKLALVVARGDRLFAVGAFAGGA